MDSILREKLMNHASTLAKVSHIYRTESSRFVDEYLKWIEQSENDISGLRSPIGLILQAEKTKVTSVMDGYMPEYIKERGSIRRSQRAVAAQSLSYISQLLHEKINQIDSDFREINEKICHALAILSGKDRNLFKINKVNESIAEKIWKGLEKHPETLPMFNYLSAKLTAIDRKYLFISAIQNMIDNSSHLKKEDKADNTKENNKPGRLEASLRLLLEEFSKLKLNEDSFDELLRQADQPAKRKKLAKQTGVKESDILLLVKSADLQRITGITFPIAYTLINSGIDSVIEFSKRNPENMHRKIVETINNLKFEIPTPDRNIIDDWIKEAKELPRALEF